jgi:serine/threonine-protein kinase
VVAARHLQLDERVAIKLLHAHTLNDPKSHSRFAREARAAAKIKSEHAARVSDVGRLKNGTPYMVMEYLEGEDLAAWLRGRGALGWTQAIEFVLQACEAVAVAHARGIVHRDLKPANLFITRRVDGTLCLKVLDFGISRVESDVSMTQTTRILGSPLYMSPEQLGAPDSVDARSDIWSLGVILFELMTGSPPFSGHTLPELVAQILALEMPPLQPERPGEPVEAIVRRCLEKDKTQRFSSVAELATALLPFAPASARLSVERIAGILGTQDREETLRDADARSSATPESRPAGPTQRRKVAVGLVLALALLSGGALAALGVRNRLNRANAAPEPAAKAEVASVAAAPAAAHSGSLPVAAGAETAARPSPLAVEAETAALPKPKAPSRVPHAHAPRNASKAAKAAATSTPGVAVEGVQAPSQPTPPTPIDPFEDRK